MAFTQEGMFYLSPEDMAGTREALGAGIRGMFGVQNKEEAVESILRGITPDDPESRAEALREIASIDPSAYARLSDIFTELDKGELSLEEKRLDVKAKKGEPSKSAYFRTSVEPNIIQTFSTDAGLPGTIRSYDQFSNTLDALVDSGQMKTGERSSKKEALKRKLKEEKTGWMQLNKYKNLESIKGGTQASSQNVAAGYASKVDPLAGKGLDDLTALREAKIQELQGLGPLAQQAMSANLGHREAINAEVQARTERLQAEINQLNNRIDREEKAPYTKDVKSIFDEYAEQYKK